MHFVRIGTGNPLITLNGVSSQVGRFSRKTFSLCLLLSLAAVAGHAAQTQTLRVTHVPAALAPLRKLQPDHRLKLAIGLPLRNQAALDELLRELYNPTSPNYRHWLTPEQFTEKFGASEDDYRHLENFLVAHGLTVTFR